MKRDWLRGQKISGRKNIFFAEYYAINFSVEIGKSNMIPPTNTSIVSHIYFGKYARMVIASNQDRKTILEAYHDRLSNPNSEKWSKMISYSDEYISLSYPPLTGEIVDSDQFFALIQDSEQNPKPIFFSVKN